LYIFQKGTRMKFDAYIDGFNLYKGLLTHHPELKWLDLPTFCRRSWPDFELERCYFFTSRIKERFPRDPAPRRQHTYLRALEGRDVVIIESGFKKNLDWLRLNTGSVGAIFDPSLHDEHGYVQNHFDSVSGLLHQDSIKAHVWKYSEKGTDVALANTLMRDSLRYGLENALVITGDSDLALPISEVKDFGTNVRVLIPNPNQTSQVLRQAANSCDTVKLDLLSGSQLPQTVKTPKGSDITRPRLWA
jgi:uncharacterized LabA/DUF88 family protein